MSGDERLRRVAEGATPGPWEARDQDVEHYFPHIGASGIVCQTGDAPNSEFIATFDPTTVLGLLDRLATAEAQVARVEALAAEWESWGLRLRATELRAALDPRQEPQDGAQGAAGVEVGSVDGGDVQGRENGREGL